MLTAATAQTSLGEAIEHEIPEEEEERAQLRALAAKFNMSLMPSGVLLQELGSAILAKMIQRIGDHIYQIGTITMRYFPKMLLEEYLPMDARKEEAGTTWWLLDNINLLTSMVPILSAAASESSCAGLSKYFRAKSQPVFRVIATLMPDMEITYVATDSEVGVLTVVMQYALVTEMGEAHWPKDTDKREMAFDEGTTTAVMEQALADVDTFYGAGHPLSPGWLRQLGHEQRAQEVEYGLAHPRRTSAPSRRLQIPKRAVKKRRAKVARQPRFTEEEYVIESILEAKKVGGKDKMRFLVRWVGWAEPTWEPLLVLKPTEALREWRQQARLR